MLRTVREKHTTPIFMFDPYTVLSNIMDTVKQVRKCRLHNISVSLFLFEVFRKSQDSPECYDLFDIKFHFALVFSA